MVGLCFGKQNNGFVLKWANLSLEARVVSTYFILFVYKKQNKTYQSVKACQKSSYFINFEMFHKTPSLAKAGFIHSIKFGNISITLVHSKINLQVLSDVR